jgi:ERCC4-related helicase
MTKKASVAESYCNERYLRDRVVAPFSQIPLPNLETILNHDLSPKIQALFSILRERASVSTELEFRCIIFVEERSTAAAVSGIIEKFAPMLFPIIKCGYVTGGNSKGRLQRIGKQGEDKSIFESFRYGDINCIVATRVAEEGVDMYVIFYLIRSPACRLVVIFDMFRSTAGYVQSRGRARHVSGAEYILLVSKGVKSQMKTLTRARAAEKLQLDIASSGSLSQEGLQEVCRSGIDDDIADTLLGFGGFYQNDQHVVSRIGAKATPNGCMNIISRYVVSSS